MWTINKKAFIFSAVVIGLACTAQLAFGASIKNPLGGAGVDAFPALLGKIAKEIGNIITVVGGLMVIIAGILFATSAGSTEQIDKAKKTLLWAVIGMVVGLSASTMTGWLSGVSGTGDIKSIIEAISKKVGDVIIGAGGVMVIVAGIMYMISAGSTELTEKAKKTLFFAVIGMIIGGSVNLFTNLAEKAASGDFFTIIKAELFPIITVLGGVMVVVAGIMYMTSAGNSQQTETAKKTLFFAVVGMIVGLSWKVFVDLAEASKGGDLLAVVTNISGQLTGVISALSIVMFIIAGIMYVTSGGNSQQMETAKKTLFYAIIGIIIGLSANAIVDWVKSGTGGGGGGFLYHTSTITLNNIKIYSNIF